MHSHPWGVVVPGRPEWGGGEGEEGGGGQFVAQSSRGRRHTSRHCKEDVEEEAVTSACNNLILKLPRAIQVLGKTL